MKEIVKADDPDCLKEFLQPERIRECDAITCLFSCKANKHVAIWFDEDEEIDDEVWQGVINKVRAAILPHCADCNQKC